MVASDGVHLSPASLADLHKLGEAYKGGDRVLQKRLRTGLQSAAKPLGEAVVRQGSIGLGRRGGLQARIARARVAVSATLAGRNPSVAIRMANSEKDSLAGLDQGLLRHMVFKRSDGPSVWVAQRVRPHQFSEAFKRNAPSVRDRVSAEVAKALDEIAREA